MLFPSLSMKKVSQHRKLSVDSGAGSSASSNASINNSSVKDNISASSGVITPKGDATSSTALINLNSSSSHSVQMKSSIVVEKGISDIRITENPISESPELTGDTENNPAC